MRLAVCWLRASTNGDSVALRSLTFIPVVSQRRPVRMFKTEFRFGSCSLYFQKQFRRFPNLRNVGV